MATQGLVTIRQGGRVVMKLIAGCSGMNAVELAASLIKNKRVPSVVEAYNMAITHRFGEQSCLVVMSATEIEFRGDGELSDLYRKTFDQPGFNPRWAVGTADYTQVVDL
jgi:hypothetical protein